MSDSDRPRKASPEQELALAKEPTTYFIRKNAQIATLTGVVTLKGGTETSDPHIIALAKFHGVELVPIPVA